MAPVLGVRNGAGWLFHPGDNVSWAEPAVDDSSWISAVVPRDWHSPPLAHNFTTGWYRKHLHNVSVAAMRVAAPSLLRLALGVVCGADQTYLNGKLLGSTGWPPATATAATVRADVAAYTAKPAQVQCKAYAIPRVYKIPTGLLRADGTDVLAVRVFSPLSEPGGLCDFSFYGPDGEQVNISDGRSGPFGSGLAFNSVAYYTSDTADEAALGWTENDTPRSQGYTAQGQGWYRKSFVMGETNLTSDHVTKVLFDGVYGVTDCWINGHHLGQHVYGYTAFSYDLTAHLQLGVNVLAVRVSNLGATSRWYSGSGIFRQVSLAIRPAVHIATFGVEVTTPSVEMVEPTVPGARSSSALCTIVVGIALQHSATTAPAAGVNDWEGSINVNIDAIPDDARVQAGRGLPASAGGRPIASGKIVTNLSGGALNGSFTVTLRNVTVSLWSPEAPQLYRCVVITSNGDSEIVTFGVKVFSSNGSGLVLNGAPIKLRGGCLHHDNGPLGAMSIGRADERRLERIKAVGYNAVRTSHNPPSSKFLDAADRLGILIIDEAFDCWHKGKNPNDYSIYFAEWWQRDVLSMVKRDMNHVSVAMFSIGNEIPDGLSPKGLSEALAIAKLIRQTDPQQRPITMGFNKGWGAPAIAELSALDIVGNNYDCSGYDRVHEQFPNKTMITTESKPAASYDFIIGVDQNAWVGGDMLWTGIDHIGEVSLGFSAVPGSIESCWGTLPWPMHLNNAGDIDIVGGIKPQSLYRQVLWDRLLLALTVQRPGSHAVAQAWGWDDEVSSWSWPGDEGKRVFVRVYSKCLTVSVSLNGVVVGVVHPSNNRFNASVSIQYEPGNLSAICVPTPRSTDIVATANRTASFALVTAGRPAMLRLVADSSTVGSGEDDLAYVTVELLDAHGNVCDHPSQQRTVTFEVSGTAAIFRVGNGDPVDVSSFTANRRKTWRGRALCVLQPTLGSNGTAWVTAAVRGVEAITQAESAISVVSI